MHDHVTFVIFVQVSGKASHRSELDQAAINCAYDWLSERNRPFYRRIFEVEKLVQDGRILPMFKDEVIAFAASLDDSQTVSFSADGEATTRKDWFMSYLAKQPQVVSFGEMNLGVDPFTTPRKPTASVPDGYQVDRKGAEMHQKINRIANGRASVLLRHSTL